MLKQNLLSESCTQTCNFFCFLHDLQRAIRAVLGIRCILNRTAAARKAETGRRMKAVDDGNATGQDALRHLDNFIEMNGGTHRSLHGIRAGVFVMP